MKKKTFGRQFKRDTDERKSLFKGLIASLILRERIKTTEAKAKAIKSEVEKIITIAKKGETVRNFLQRFVYQHVLEKLIKDIAPRFEKRRGGYTRIIRLGERMSDRAKIVFIEWTEGPKELVLAKENKEIVNNDKKEKANEEKKVDQQKKIRVKKTKKEKAQ